MGSSHWQEFFWLLAGTLQWRIHLFVLPRRDMSHRNILLYCGVVRCFTRRNSVTCDACCRLGIHMITLIPNNETWLGHTTHDRCVVVLRASMPVPLIILHGVLQCSYHGEFVGALTPHFLLLHNEAYIWSPLSQITKLGCWGAQHMIDVLEYCLLVYPWMCNIHSIAHDKCLTIFDDVSGDVSDEVVTHVVNDIVNDIVNDVSNN
jgi:hypothetical protein